MNLSAGAFDVGERWVGNFVNFSEDFIEDLDLNIF
jgi:hypothetical protein